MFARLLFSVLVLAGLASRAQAAARLVANAAELQSAIAAAKAGDSIVMKNGTWNNAVVTFKAAGAEDRPITLTAQTGGQVLLAGTSRFVIDGSWLTLDGVKFENSSVGANPFVQFTEGSSHCRFTNSAILNCKSSDERWVYLRAGSQNRVDHCWFSGMTNLGQLLQVEAVATAPDNFLIDNNFFGNRKGGNGNGWETMRIGYSHQQTFSCKTTVQRNLFYKCDGEIEIVSNKSSDNRMIDNTFLDCQGQLTLRHGHRAWVEGNFFLGYNASFGSGVRVIGQDHAVVNNYFGGLKDYGITIYQGERNPPETGYEQVKNALIAFNTIVDCPLAFEIGGGGGGLAPTDCKIANNLVLNANGTLATYQMKPVNTVFEGNIARVKSLGIADPGGVAQKDPVLVKAADGVFRPAPESPAKDAAVGAYAAVIRDLNSSYRAPTGKDVGAIEIGASVEQRKPLSEKDVGPWWMGNVSPREGEVVAARIATPRLRFAPGSFGVDLLGRMLPKGRISPSSFSP